MQRYRRKTTVTVKSMQIDTQTAALWSFSIMYSEIWLSTCRDYFSFKYKLTFLMMTVAI